VANHASNNAVPSTDLSGLIETVFNTLSGLGAPPAEPEQEPAVPIKKSVSKKFIACLECGKEQKMLKRHLHSAHDTNPVEYRAKWGLAHDYPMVAPVYAALRRRLAKEIGLGRKRKS
jgi:predicted transcriptional regulator